jgi:hypothetical protein
MLTNTKQNRINHQKYRTMLWLNLQGIIRDILIINFKLSKK